MFPQLQLGAARREDKHNTIKHTCVGLTDVVFLRMLICSPHVCSTETKGSNKMTNMSRLRVQTEQSLIRHTDFMS